MRCLRSCAILALGAAAIALGGVALGADVRDWRVTIDTGDAEHATGVATGPQGTVVVGTASVPREERARLLLTRRLPDGSPDPSFGTRGIVDIDLGMNPESGPVLVQRDGRIVVAADTEPRFDERVITIVRRLADGSADSAFGGGDGIVEIRPTAFGARFEDNACAVPAALALQPDGRLLVAGTIGCGGEAGPTRAALVRLLPDGDFDATFGRGGTRLVDVGRCASGSSVAIGRAGRIVLGVGAGDCYETRSPLRVARLLSDGRLDAGFGRNGHVRVDVPGRANAYTADVMVDRAGGIVLVGSAEGRGRHAVVVDVRLSRAGRARLVQTATVPGRSLYAWAGAVLSDGRVAVVADMPGRARGVDGIRARIAVFRSGGPPALRPVGFRDGANAARAVAVAGDALLLAGWSRGATDRSLDIGIARVTP
jgi:uncharacterized delta-60 repeat protein